LIARHKDLVISIGFLLPVIQSVGGAFTNLGTAALPVIANITNALRFGLVGALSAVEAAVMASGIVALIAAAGYLGYKAGDWPQQKFAPGGNPSKFDPDSRWQVVGHDVVERTSPRPKIGSSIIDFLSDKPSGSSTQPPPSNTDSELAAVKE